jgi:hypothetical protein
MMPYGIFMKKAPRPDTFEGIIDEVVFCCSLGESALIEYLVLFCVWTRPQTDAVYMNDFLAL